MPIWRKGDPRRAWQYLLAGQQLIGAAAVHWRLQSRHSDLCCQPYGRQEPDGEPSHVDLPPFVAVARRMGVGMMIVVPALAITDEGDKRIVAAIVGRFVIAIPPQMRDRIDCPGEMAMHDGAHDHAPEPQAKTELNRHR